MKRRFWALENAGGEDEGAKRWIVETQWDWEKVHRRLEACRPISSWNENEAVLLCDHTEHLEDCPCTADGSLIVSDRFCEFLAEIDPKGFQFLPVQMRWATNHELIRERYWAVNVLRELDCLDYSRAMYKDQYVGWAPDVLVVNPAKVNKSDLLGRVRDRHFNFIVREDVRDRIVAAGMTGVYFYKVWHSDDEEAPPARPWPPPDGS